MQCTAHTSISQPETFHEACQQIHDPRAARGKRHALASVLRLVFSGLTRGCEDITACVEWAGASQNKRKLFSASDFPHGLPHPSTVGRLFARLNPTQLVKAYTVWQRCQGKEDHDTAASLDGKTLRGVHGGKKIIKHILSLFTHHSHQLLGQVGVTKKENEIVAAPKLLKQLILLGVTVTADALLTQHRDVEAILTAHADYLLMVKSNQSELESILEAGFNDPHLKKEVALFNEVRKTRLIATTISISRDFDFAHLGWQGAQCVGKLERLGKRVSKGETTPVHEVVYFISSRDDLSPQQAYNLIRGHWAIENNLHWQKDHTFLEDRQTLRKGAAPQIMSILRSFVLSLLAANGYTKISQTIRAWNHSPTAHHQFLRQAHIFA